MRRIIVGAIFKDNKTLVDFLSRFIHHFQFHKDIRLIILRDPELDINKVNYSLCIDSLVSPDIPLLLRQNRFDIVFKQITDTKTTLSELGACTACLIYDEGFYKKNYASLKEITKKFYYCDPLKTRQEGSNFIQASLDLLPNADKSANEANSASKFLKLKEALGELDFERATIFATGPSIAKFKEFDYSKSLNIYCNSTILDQELLETAPPNILTFADPIFHFGVSEYANSFRVSCGEFLKSYANCVIIIPIKYYALAISLFPDYHDKIIGIPFTKHRPINFEITEKDFYTYTTSNILTLSLLPVATTFAKSVRLIGCDGREVSDDSYFWSHGTSVQINDKMKAIQRAHPGFFNIDYNQYYFEHCHNLNRMLLLAEERGWNFLHLGRSYIPALKSRAVISSEEQASKSEVRNCVADSQTRAFIIIEPDGLRKGDGHYEIWHRNLEQVAKRRNIDTYIICNKSSQLYTSTNAFPVLSRHSWQISMASYDSLDKMMQAASFEIFYCELKSVIENILYNKRYSVVSLYMYYGSAHHLQAFIKLKKELESSFPVLINANCTLSFESIRFTPDRKQFWGDGHGHFKSILLESQYFFPSIKVFTMTSRFSQYIFKEYDILLPTLVHPILSENMPSSPVGLLKTKELSSDHEPSVLLIGRYTVGKFPPGYFDLLDKILKKSNVNVRIRNSSAHADKIKSIAQKYENRVFVLPCELSDREFDISFESADIVIIPYLPDNFLMRTSGVLTDAVMHEKPVICFGQSSISDTVDRHRIGIYCNCISSQSVLSAMQLIYANYSLYQKAVVRYKNNLIKNSTFARQLNDCLADKVILNVQA